MLQPAQGTGGRGGGGGGVVGGHTTGDEEQEDNAESDVDHIKSGLVWWAGGVRSY